MSDEQQGEQNLEETLREIVRILSMMTPPTIAEVEDLSGAIHKVRANLPASRESEIAGLLKEITLPDNAAEAADGVLKAQKDGDRQKVLQGFATAIGAAANSGVIVETLGKAFTIAHPHLVERAIANCQADEDVKHYLPEGKVEAHHVFSTVDLLGGIVPFVMRAVGRIGTTVDKLLPPTT